MLLFSLDREIGETYSSNICNPFEMKDSLAF